MRAFRVDGDECPPTRATAAFDMHAHVAVFGEAQNTDVKGKGNEAKVVIARVDEKAGIAIEKP